MIYARQSLRIRFHVCFIMKYWMSIMPLRRNLKICKLSVSFRSAVNDEVMVTHSIRLPKQGTVANVFDIIRTLVALSRPNAELRLLGISLHRICVNIPPSEKIGNINPRFLSSLRVEEIPEEEKNLGPRDRLVPILQFRKATAKEQRFFWYFGEPFFLIVHEGESLAEIKVRIQKKFRIPDGKFVQLKFSFIPWRGLTSRQDLQDSDIVFSYFQIPLENGSNILDWSTMTVFRTLTVPKRAYVAKKNRFPFCEAGKNLLRKIAALAEP
ncbi:ubiquitin C-terminal hydrolase 12-like isoform X2 [Macadamia integrifolia]|uniref:ubiquitin C-terminal hydrolase 12-like isoform X2 n=1 Tax=Macadamia integrifolia TaxID=60698 RepID=UPI001C4E7122|nr:ubiquitin C-terminal hydrolase 12-like isoform X2 [Macadamia integrifolia]XP_042505818.1 ubiquitin C-terminal hydrolase 12-like isoform X2 [Macadamia integrifolia]